MKETIEQKLNRIQLEAKNRVKLLVHASWPEQTQVQQMNPFCGEAVPAVKPKVKPKATPVVPLVQPAQSFDMDLFKAELQKETTKQVRNYVADVSEKIKEITFGIREDALAKLNNNQVVLDCTGKSIIYPNNCKYLYITNDNQGCIVIEDQPQIRTIFGPKKPGSDDAGKMYRIPFPYIVYVINFSKNKKQFEYYSLVVGFGTKPIQSVDDILLNPTLPHMRGNTQICMPVPKEIIKNANLQSLCNDIIKHFWNTKFWYRFEDWGAAFQLENEEWITSFNEWEKHDILEILKAKFNKGSKLSDIMAQFATTNYGGHLAQQITQVLNSSAQKTSCAVDQNELSKIIQDVIQQTLNKMNIK